jgi:RimJ/RimL family protein N-acetyltransferase
VFESTRACFAFLPEHQGKGLTFDATTAFLEGLKKRGSFVQLLGITLADNTNSINLLQRLGFGFLREVKQHEKD